MRAFAIRVLKNGLPVAALLAALGYGYAQMAEMMTGKPDRPTPAGVPEVRDVLRYRVPLTMAAWGLGFVVAFEALFSLWRRPLPPVETRPPAPDEAELLLMKLLEEADAAERARQMPSPADPTPPPRGPAPAGHFADSGLANTPR